MILPDISGIEMIRQVRELPRTGNLPIVVVSAKMEEGRLAINGGYANIDWLAKPFNEGQLLDSIESAVSTSAIMCPRILHVEDDVDLHQVVRAMLGDRYDCDLVTTLRDARDLIALERFDVVILDIGLPDGSGWDLLEELRAQQPWIRVFILSGNDLTTEQSHKVESVLLKSRISTQKLLETLDKQVNSISKRP